MREANVTWGYKCSSCADIPTETLFAFQRLLYEEGEGGWITPRNLIYVSVQLCHFWGEAEKNVAAAGTARWVAKTCFSPDPPSPRFVVLHRWIAFLDKWIHDRNFAKEETCSYALVVENHFACSCCRQSAEMEDRSDCKLMPSAKNPLLLSRPTYSLQTISWREMGYLDWNAFPTSLAAVLPN